MSKVGKVLHTTPRGIIARLDAAPKLGEVLWRSNKRPIGRVLDIFGPVRRPYVLVRPAKDLGEKDLVSLSGEEVYRRGKS